MKTYYLFNIDSCIIFRRISRLNGNKISRSGNPIHHYPYRVILLSSLSKTYFKIHVDIFPHKSRNSYFLYQTTLILVLGLHLLTFGAFCNKLRNIFFYTILQKFPSLDHGTSLQNLDEYSRGIHGLSQESYFSNNLYQAHTFFLYT